MQLQILDSDYIMVNGRPLVRIFGKSADGGTSCVFSNDSLPYIYLYTKDLSVASEIKREYGVSVELVEKFLPVGYSEKPVKMLKLIGNDPGEMPRLREAMKKYGDVYEADILFKYRYLIDHKLKGMQWIEVEGEKRRSNSVKCEIIEASRIAPVQGDHNAPLRYMAIDIECMSDSLYDRLPDPQIDQIVIVSISFFPDYKGAKNIVLVAKQAKGEGVLGFGNEKDMLSKFLDILNDYDPDILVGYNINNFDLPYMIKRLEVLELPGNLGRDDKRSFSKKMQNSHMHSITGRVVVDPYEILKRDPWVKYRRYDLGTVSKAILGEDKVEMDGIREMHELWYGANTKKFIEYAKKDSELVLRLVIEKHMLDKFFELAKISGLLLQDALGGQSQRHECRLLHEFRDANFVMTCKPDEMELQKRKLQREKLGLKGALVLEPEVGFHKDGGTIVLDFTSLYPSLILTYNICPTTLLLNDEPKPCFDSPTGARFVKHETKEGIMPKILRELIETRKKVRKEISNEKDPERRRILNAKQLALKDMANSLYGYTGYIRARLYVLDVASVITAFGREIITKTKMLIEEKYPVKVIYSDTDSVFIKTNIKDLDMAWVFGKEISDFITEALPGVLELKLEKIYKSFLILTKKRYAGWSFEKEGDGWKDKIEMKGIETVRRDWCELVSESLTDALNIILKEGDVQKASKHIRGVIKYLFEGKIPLEKLTVVKGISRALDRYDGVQPHVELAKKIKARDPSKTPVVGERLQYVIIKGNQMLSKRAEDPDFVRKNNLKVDTQYYLENQLLPPLERIFEVCGIGRSELIEGSRQRSLFMFNDQKSAEETVLERFDSVVCKKCNWSSTSPTLSGTCPTCRGELYFESSGSIGKFTKVDMRSHVNQVNIL